MKKQTFYYTELTDDVYDDHIKEKVIDEKYKYYSKNWFYRFVEFVYYHIIIFPIAFIYCRLIKHIKYVGRKKLKKAKKTGCFIYANHTHPQSDAFSPSQIASPKKIYIIVNPSNLNVPVFKSSTKMLGALPLPTGLKASRNFADAIKHRLDQKAPILIYPEAKIWPQYTDIRPFAMTSFKYPITYQKPVYTFTTTYQKTNHNKCKMVIYVDGPFYADVILPPKEQQQVLHDLVYQTMKERVRLSTYQTHQYIQKEKTE